MKYILFFLLFSQFLIAKIPYNYITTQDLIKLSKEERWLKLLSYDEEGKKSDIVSKSFFLSKNGDTNPLAELNSTIQGYTLSLESNNSDNHPRCRFPARYLWLSQYIEFPQYTKAPSYCKKLLSTSFFKETQSISIFLVSGYLGNPASTFGHSFIKLNSAKQESQSELLDLSINYGALVPPNEGILPYILKGIGGGYESAFSDKPYYHQDLTYSHEEVRDMWEYTLNLKPQEKELFLYHIWEIVGKKNVYYFVDENCGYRVGKLLELVIPENIVSSSFWYVPVESFHRLEEINNQRESDNKLILETKYLPSKQREINAHYDLLKKEEKKYTQSFLLHENRLDEDAFTQLSKAQKVNSLDFLLDYYTLKLAKDSNNSDLLATKQQLMIERFKYDISSEKNISIKKRDSPAKGNKPSYLSVGVKNEHQKYGIVGFSPFCLESTGKNSLQGDELIVLDSKIAFDYKHIYLDAFDLIKIKKFNTFKELDNFDETLSWELHIGTKRNYDEKSYDTFVDGGIGKAYKIGDDLTSYAFLTSKANFDTMQSGAKIGLDIKVKNLKTNLSTAKVYDFRENDFLNKYEIQTQYQLEDNLALLFQYKQEKYDSLYFGLKSFY